MPKANICTELKKNRPRTSGAMPTEKVYQKTNFVDKVAYAKITRSVRLTKSKKGPRQYEGLFPFQTENCMTKEQRAKIARENGTKSKGPITPATVNLFSTGELPGDRVFRHAQVVEDETRPEGEVAHPLSDGLRGFLK